MRIARPMTNASLICAQQRLQRKSPADFAAGLGLSIEPSRRRNGIFRNRGGFWIV
jgi:hypothetical protein